MSKQSLDYIMRATVGSNQRLLAYYDFSGMSGRHIGVDFVSQYTSMFENCDPAVNTGLYSGIVIDSNNDSIAGSKLFTTGTFLNGDQAHLNNSNIKVTGIDNLNFASASALFDFEFNNEVSDCVLFGSLEKTSTTINDETFEGAKGYNFGLTKRGHLFYQSFNNNGDFIKFSSSIELSKRNIVGFSVGGNTLSLVSCDYLNNKINQATFTLDTSFIANNEEFYLGGSDEYFRGSNGAFKTSDISLNSFVLLSGRFPPSVMFQVGSGMAGSYFEDAGTTVFKDQLTGYSETITYKTGITGYDYEDTGSINMSTGDYMLTGSFFNAVGASIAEGDRYFIYRSFNDALSDSGVSTFVKEEVGALYGGMGSGYQYTPTGENAFDTLGLRDIDVAINEYTEVKGISGAATVGVTLFGSRMLTGVTTGISGISQTPLYQKVIDKPAIASSGVKFLGESAAFKKNFIKFLGREISS
jgi:hypothetical protein